MAVKLNENFSSNSLARHPRESCSKIKPLHTTVTANIAITINRLSNDQIIVTHPITVTTEGGAIITINPTVTINSPLKDRTIEVATTLVKESANKEHLPLTNKEWLFIAIWVSGVVLGTSFTVLGISTQNPMLLNLGMLMLATCTSPIVRMMENKFTDIGKKISEG